MKKLVSIILILISIFSFSQKKKNNSSKVRISNEKLYILVLENGLKNETNFNFCGLKVSSKNLCNEKVEFFTNIPLYHKKTKKKVDILNLPKNLKAFDLKWSPNYERIAFCHVGELGTELWWIDMFNKTAKKMEIEHLNCYFGCCYNWLSDSNSFVVKQFPNDQYKKFSAKNEEFLNSNDLIKEFKKITFSEYNMYNLLGDKKKLIKADYYCFDDFSPDGNYILTSKINKFDKDVIYKHFEQTFEVFDKRGQFIKEIEYHDYFHPKEYYTVRTEKRNIRWKSDKGSTLTYVIAVDGGEVQKSVEYRDELWVWNAPFEKEPQLIMKSMNRLAE